MLRDGREAFIPLYTTFRDFDNDPETPFTLELEYRDANVIGQRTQDGELVVRARIDKGVAGRLRRAGARVATPGSTKVAEEG